MKPTSKVRFRAAYVLSMLFTVFLFPSCMKNTVEPTASPLTRTADAAVTPALSIGLGDGVNLQPSYYNGGNPNFGWSLMKQEKNIKTVRIEIEPSIAISQAKSWISQAASNGFAIIATYHKASVLGSDKAAALTAAANWWKTNYSAL